MIINFIIYKTATGEILRSGHCPAFAIENVIDNENEGILFAEGLVNDTKFKVANGQIVEKTPEEYLRDNPPNLIIPDMKNLTVEEYDSIISRLDALENK